MRKKIFAVVVGVVFAVVFTEVVLYLSLRFTDIPWGPGVTPFQEKYFQRNSRGYRDIEWEEEKNVATKRIVVIGDSFVFGSNKDVNDSLVPRLRHSLTVATTSAIEIISLGKIGANTRDELYTLQTDGSALEPDLIILVYVPNDADPLTRSEALLPKHTFNFLQEFRLFLGSMQNSVIHSDDSILRHFLKTRSFIFNLLDTSVGRILTTLNIRPTPLEGETRQFYRGENLLSHQEDLISFIQLTKQHNIPLLIVYFPFLFRIEDDPFADIAAMVKTIAEEENVAFLDLTETLAREPTEELIIGWWDAHPNGKANQVAAEAIAKKLDKL